MVSLENSKNAKGGFSFDAITPTNDDIIETTSTHALVQNDNLPLTVEVEPTFKQIGTTFAIVAQIFTVIILEVGVFVLPIICGEKDEKCQQFGGFDIIVFIHAGFWILKYIFDRFYHYQHMWHRRQGYLEFYRLTRWLRTIPFLVISASNSLLVVLIKVLNKYCPPETKCTSAELTDINFLQIFISVESAILIPTLIYYLVLTVKFNVSRKSPDINKEMDRPVFLPSQLKDLGYKDSSYVNNVLENQADMIRYLQERNQKLTQKLFELTEKSNSANIN